MLSWIQWKKWWSDGDLCALQHLTQIARGTFTTGFVFWYLFSIFRQKIAPRTLQTPGTSPSHWLSQPWSVRRSGLVTQSSNVVLHLCVVIRCLRTEHQGCSSWWLCRILLPHLHQSPDPPAGPDWKDLTEECCLSPMSENCPLLKVRLKFVPQTF